MRTSRWGKSRYSWKAQLKHPPAPARLTRCTTERGQHPHTPSCATRSPGSQADVPPSRRPPRRLASGPICTCPPPPLQDQGCLPQGGGPLARAPGHPPAPLCRPNPRGPGAGPGGTPTNLYGAAPVPCSPLPAHKARDGVHTFLQTQKATVVRAVDLMRLFPATPDDPCRARAPFFCFWNCVSQVGAPEP